MEAILEDCYILVTDQKISAISSLLPLLEKLIQAGKKDLVIIAEDVDGEALATLVVNKLRGTFNVLAVKAPGYGERKKELLLDIATVCGAEFISEETGRKLENTDVSALGQAHRVVANKDKTTIVGGKGSKQEIEKRISQIKSQLQKADSEFDREKLRERLGKLSGGVAVIRVGAPTEVEQKEKQHRVEDALSATRAAVGEGIVPGGGVALIRAISSLDKLEANGDERIGIDILRRALEEPARQIAENAGQEGSVVVEEIKKRKANEGYNAAKDRYEDMLQAGIIDPTKVTRSALQNAASAAAMLLTTEAVITDEPEKEDKRMPAMPEY